MVQRYVEERHEAKTARRVVDVRPASTRYAEWLSEKFNLLMVTAPILFFAAVIPSIAPILFLVVLVHIIIHNVTKPILPFRYPAGNKQKDHKGKKGTGILLMGYVESDSEYEKFKEIWQSDDDLRKHMLIIGSTGSGKSESLKGIFFNSLCWASGFFVADGKADNKLPTDTFTMVRSFGRDDDLLFLNFLLGGKTPEQVRKSRRRRTNKINPVSSADADTIIQMGANMLPKVEGEGKNWQEKALNLWRAVIQALCYMRDTDINGIERADLSISTIIDYLSLPKVEELYLIGHGEFLEKGEWSHGFNGVKAYLESGCPAYKTEKLLAKNGLGDQPPLPGGRPPAAGGKAFEQDSMAYEQHAYRTSQLMPVLNLLDKTYGFIFRDKFPEIDMIDATLNNRILVMLIPSLEKSAQEAENLGKLAIACLRVMMGKNLGSEIEGTRNELLNSKATAAPYPYMIALDELAYYFADGIAVMFAQARSLGFCMIAAAQDLEKLTEGTRAAEAGAMLANQVSKWFMRIDDANKTFEFIGKILGKVSVAVRHTFELDSLGYKRSKEIDVQEVERVSLREMQEKNAGEAVFNSAGKTVRANSFYVGRDLDDHRNEDFFVLRFLQVEPPSAAEIDEFSIVPKRVKNASASGSKLIEILRYQSQRAHRGEHPPKDAMISAVETAAGTLGNDIGAAERAIALYAAAKKSLLNLSEEPGTSNDGQEASRDAIQRDPEHPYNEYEFGEPMEDDDAGIDPDDPLAFMNSTFERKPADILLSRSDNRGIEDEPDEMLVASGLQSEDPVQMLIRSGKTLNLRHEALESEFAVAEAATMRALTGMKSPNDGDETDWVNDAIEAANRVLLTKSIEGKTVVGFSETTTNNVVRIEELLGSPAPKNAANRLEAVVSAQVTPDMEIDPLASYRAEDVEGFFNNLKD